MEHATQSAHHLAPMLSNILLFFGIAGIVVPLLQRLRMGAKYVVAETLESSLCVARLLMQQIGTDDAAIEKIIRKLREHNAVSGT